MSELETVLRNLLDRTVVQARDVAEEAARVALQRLCVDAAEPHSALSPEERALRRALRAKMRQDGGWEALVSECAYEHWHRRLFARFLAENHLLMHPEGVAVTLEECEELAPEEGAADGWALAGRYASRMLPAIFRPDDPLLAVTLAPEHQQALDRLLAELPAPVFAADDSLGWVYQFWQAKRKKEVNESGDKIDASTIGPVTQLFTEHYMVQFLLHNTLGAWWFSRHPGEQMPVEMPYLRFTEEGKPAAGEFPGWPDTAAELRLLDPCAGSAHFLVAGFKYLRCFRMVEEGLGEAAAGDAVLRDNLFGLEIDNRCVQIAAFNLALAAWKAGGYRELPALHLACSGTPVAADVREWLALANGDERLSAGMRHLHRLFSQAPDLGSLIDPTQHQSTLEQAGYVELQPLLAAAMEKEKARRDDSLHFAGVAAEGIARAAEILAGRYNLVATNVPYLGRRDHGDVLRAAVDQNHPNARQDLATAFLERCLDLCDAGGSVGVVTPQNWLFLKSYWHMREGLLKRHSWNAVAKLGPGAFETIGGHVVNVVLLVVTRSLPAAGSTFAAIDASGAPDPVRKADALACGVVQTLRQTAQLQNPEARVALEVLGRGDLLSVHADSYAGIQSGDYSRYGRCFWETPEVLSGWCLQQSTSQRAVPWHGCEHVLFWEDGQGALASDPSARVQGVGARGHVGICISLMQTLMANLYTGEMLDNNTAVILPRDPSHLPAIWAFCSSPEFSVAVRRIDQSLKVTNAVLLKVPFDLAHWQRVAEERGPLPEQYSEYPTQWLFLGDPACTTAPLQVAVARLLRYQWPKRDDDHLTPLADDDGIVCLPSVSGERPAADRLRDLLAAAYREDWSAARQSELLTQAGSAGKTLDAWLLDGFFAQHCALFHQRPFIWHVWDGRKDGFSALVNYHKLDYARLERLTYTYLGDWIVRQQQADRDGEGGASARVVAAQDLQRRLKLILDGEAPYDIFVRWKPLDEQPIGWNPDLNDGVRLNIRPFVTAGVLRKNPTINWNKDRGKNPPGSPWGEDRINDRHLTLAEKRAAREEAGKQA